MKNRTLQFVVLIPVLSIVAWGLFSPNGIRAAVANNAWSVMNIQHFYNPTLEFPQFSHPPRTHAHAPLFLALNALQAGNYDQALTIIQPLIDAGDPLATNTYAQILFNTGKFGTAFALWEITGNTRELENAAASLPEDSEDLRIQAYRSLYRINPEKYAIELAIRLRSIPDGTEIIELIQQSIRDFPRSGYQALWRRYLGDMYVLQGDVQNAEQAYRFAMLAPEPEYKAWRNLGYLYLNTNEYDKAAEVFRELSILYPQDPYPLTQVGEAYQRAGSIPLAIEAYQQALLLDPDNEQIKVKLESLSGQD